MGVLSTQLAKDFCAAGVNVQPVWAKGAIVLADCVCQAVLEEIPHPWHVAVSECNESQVYEALQSLPYNLRPRLKKSCGRYYIPSDTSLLADVSESDPADVAYDEDSFEESDSEVQLLDVKLTFLHVPPAPMHSVSSRAHTV